MKVRHIAAIMTLALCSVLVVQSLVSLHEATADGTDRGEVLSMNSDPRHETPSSRTADASLQEATPLADPPGSGARNQRTAMVSRSDQDGVTRLEQPSAEPDLDEPRPDYAAMSRQELEAERERLSDAVVEVTHQIFDQVFDDRSGLTFDAEDARSIADTMPRPRPEDHISGMRIPAAGVGQVFYLYRSEYPDVFALRDELTIVDALLDE